MLLSNILTATMGSQTTLPANSSRSLRVNSRWLRRKNIANNGAANLLGSCHRRKPIDSDVYAALTLLSSTIV